MSNKSIPAEADITGLAGHRFPGGFYTVAHWENFLLTECTGAQLLPHGMVHPVALFHVPIQGAGTSIAELFALVNIGHYDIHTGLHNSGWTC